MNAASVLPAARAVARAIRRRDRFLVRQRDAPEAAFSLS